MISTHCDADLSSPLVCDGAFRAVGRNRGSAFVPVIIKRKRRNVTIKFLKIRKIIGARRIDIWSQFVRVPQ